MGAFVLLVALAPVAFGATIPSGTATAQNTILSLSIGSTNVQLGVDTVSSNWAKTRVASAEMLLGQAGDLVVTGGKKTSTSRSDGGSVTIAKRTVDLGSLAGLSVANGSLAAFVQPDHVASSVDLTAGSINLFDTFATLESAGVHTITRVEQSKATVTRTVSLGSAELLAIGDLLDQLGINPLSLTCDAVEEAGANLGVSTSQTCEQLTDVDGSIQAAQDELDAQKSALETELAPYDLATVLADKDTVEALTCASGDVVCEAAALATITALNLANGYGVDLTGLSFNDARDAMLAKLAELEEAFDDLDVLTAAIADAVSGTCADVSAALDDVVTEIPDLEPTLTPLQDDVDAACAALAETIGTLLDTPLLSFNAINVSLATTAAVGKPAATVTGTLGSIKVGTLQPIGTTLSLTDSDLKNKVATLQTAVSDVLTSLGLPAPVLQTMATTANKGKRSDGTWYANASLTALYLKIPSATVDVPTDNPLGVLDGTVAPAKPAKRAVGGPRAPVTTPAIVLNAAKFTGASTFLPDEGGLLPITGIADGPAGVATALLLLTGAAMLRRYILATPR
jgi:hypothetical protein